MHVWSDVASAVEELLGATVVIDGEGRGLAFILATPRSGTTLLGAMLGSNSQVACPPEPWFLLPLLNNTEQRPGIITSYDHDLAQQAARDSVNEPLHLEASTAYALTVYNRWLGRAKKRIIVDKGTRSFSVSRQLRTMFPCAHYIWLQRNPLDVIASYKTTWNVKVSDLFGPIVSPNSLDIAASFDILQGHFAAVARSHVMRYEDLVSGPSSTIAALCAFLRIPYESEMVTYFLNSELMSAYQLSRFGDRKIHQELSIHSRSVGAWRDVLTKEEVATVLFVLGSDPFTMMGYEDVLSQAIEHTGYKCPEITTGGQRSTYLRALAHYPQCNDQTLLSSPSLWPGAVGYTSSHAINRAFTKAIEEKEASIAQLAREARSRLALLSEMEAAVSQLTHALEDRQALILKLTETAEQRLALLAEAEAVRAQLVRDLQEALRALELRDERQRQLTTESERRLTLLASSEATVTQYEQDLDDARRALEEKEAIIASLAHEAEVRRQALEDADAQWRLLEQALTQNTPRMPT